MSWKTEILLVGAGQGDVLRLDAPISFWGGIDPETSRVVLAGHPQHGKQIADKMVAIPNTVGSSSSSAVLLELIHQGIAPAGIILGRPDAILPIGGIAARQMGWRPPPIVVLRDHSLQSGERISICEDGLVQLL